ncbi:uncharacterized protein LOC111361083 [Spodoptera litura]|uniref:Uncharacterized protein LOC111361083 n=1 Tax=Spodoptera litura TaxID=69820 RepID=A0A9J7EMK2_SPOLT|nr:uncharacterized protein LOC111361083 [Spodoptera litura]
MICKKTKAPLELGEWRYDLKHMDSAVVENPPVSINEGQMYVYENYFPNYTIKYIHVDNLAIRSCGASAAMRTGGIGSSYVLIVLHAHINEEIRSVVDIWGERKKVITEELPRTPLKPDEMTSLKSLYLFKHLRAVNHNSAY